MTLGEVRSRLRAPALELAERVLRIAPAKVCRRAGIAFAACTCRTALPDDRALCDASQVRDASDKGREHFGRATCSASTLKSAKRLSIWRRTIRRARAGPNGLRRVKVADEQPAIQDVICWRHVGRPSNRPQHTPDRPPRSKYTAGISGRFSASTPRTHATVI
jgi:hypothetical protein